MKLKKFAILTFIYPFLIQNSFADLSEIDRWKYIKSLIESRAKLNTELSVEFITEPTSAQEVQEGLYLIGSFLGEEDTSSQELSLETLLIHDDKPIPKHIFLPFWKKMYTHDFLPWRSLLDKMEHGESSFNAPSMLTTLEKLNDSLAAIETDHPPKKFPQLFEPAMITTLYLEVNHQITAIKKFGLDKPEELYSLSDQERTLEFIAVKKIQQNIHFLKALRKHLFELMDDAQKVYILSLNHLTLFDSKLFVDTIREIPNLEWKRRIAYKNLMEKVFSLERRVTNAIRQKKQENLEVAKLSRIEVNAGKALNDPFYFERILLPLLDRKSKFLEDSMIEKFSKLSDQLKELTENYKKQDQLSKKLLGDTTGILLESCMRMPGEFEKTFQYDLKVATVNDFLKNEENRLKLLTFGFYIRSKAIPFFLDFIRKSENLEKAIETLLYQIKDLKKSFKNSSSPPKSAAQSITQKEVESSIKLEEETESKPLITEKTPETHVGFNQNDLGEESAEIPKIGHQSREALILQLAGDTESLNILQEIEEVDLSKIEEDAEIFSQPIEDEYTHQILEKIKGKHFEVLRAIYSRPTPKIRFETLQSLVKRCGGSLRFDGGGSSHFQITLPGGYTGRSWRPHGGAHSEKIQMRAMDGFRDALKGIANILGITDDR